MSRVEIYRETFRANWHDGTLQLNVTQRSKWRWRFVSNGHTMADSGQGYSRRIDCLNGCATVLGCDITPTGTRIETNTHRFIPVVDLTKAAS